MMGKMIPCSLASEQSLVCIIMLNYNGRDHLEYCLPSLMNTTYPNCKIIVVDNASPDNSADKVNKLCPNALLIRSNYNRGWSGGNNMGILTAMNMEAKYIVFANNDIKVDPRWLWEAVAVAEANPRIGVIGFKILELEPGSQDRDAGFELAKMNWHSLEITCPKYVGGMAMFVRAELLNYIGLFDEDFFAYGEENDFQIRARKAGYEVIEINMPVWHYGQGSFGKIPIRASALQTRHNIRLLIKHGSFLDLMSAAYKYIRLRVLPFKRVPINSAIEKRLQTSTLVVNLSILTWSVLWNIVMLPKTIKRRKEDGFRVAQAKKKWI